MKHAKQHDSIKQQWEPNVTTLPIGSFNTERMKDALAQPQIMAPRGMSRDEIIHFICSHAPKK